MAVWNWSEDELLPRTDEMRRGAAPHQRELRFLHPEWHRAGDYVRIGSDQKVGTGKFFYGQEIFRVTNECIRIVQIRDDGVALCERGVGANPPQRIRKGDATFIVAGATS